jgi:hypothetical protein
MSQDGTEESIREHVEIGIRFRRMIEQRIARLEADASNDEAEVKRLCSSDHIRRQMCLVSAQRNEALRMRRFLEKSSIRLPVSPSF